MYVSNQSYCCIAEVLEGKLTAAVDCGEAHARMMMYNRDMARPYASEQGPHSLAAILLTT